MITLQEIITVLLSGIGLSRIISILDIEASIILGILLIIIALKMLVDLLRNEETIIDFKYMSLIFLAFTVSIDSFVTGIGISAITNSLILSSIIFCLCAGTISYLGLKLGEYSRHILGNYANYIGIIILFVIGIKSFFV